MHYCSYMALSERQLLHSRNDLLKENTNKIPVELLKPNRPEPIVDEIQVVEYTKHFAPELAVKQILAGKYVLIADDYSSGLAVLNALKKVTNNAPQDKYTNQRFSRDLYRKASQLLLLEIFNHQLCVKKSPKIGWLKILYPELDSFLLPFTDIQGLNSAWQWYLKGIEIPGLKQRIHPYYDTYFPTRFEHIELFIDWLKGGHGLKQSAFDIGIGSGVLTALLHQFHYKTVSGSDINPNALIGMYKHQQSASFPTQLWFGDLFAGSDDTYDLIVFNPPWLPTNKEHSGIDLAMYYDSSLFNRFFLQATSRLNSGGQLVILFSNLGELLISDFQHPIRHELENNHRFKLVQLTTKSVKKASNKTKRNATWRAQEKVECWILSPKNQ